MARYLILAAVLAGAGGAAAAGEAVPETESAEADELFVYDDKGKRDPLWPLVSSDGVVQNYEMEFMISDLNLEGIMFSGERQSAAIVNNRIVKEADRIGQYTVHEIRPEAVILINGNQYFELRLKKGE
jgi:hypothetical protein